MKSNVETSQDHDGKATVNSMSTQIQTTLDRIDRDAWAKIAPANNPFGQYAFLRALETSQSVGPGTGWLPNYLTTFDGGSLVGALPLYEKEHSHGEFIFDWAWADAFHRAGRRYYPKGVVAIPFTPATGARIWTDPHTAHGVHDALLEETESEAQRRGWSSVHILFCSEQDQRRCIDRGWLPRLTFQFHWENRGYATFDDFLADLRSSKRKQILRERRQVAFSGLKIRTLTGHEIEAHHMDAMWAFYCDTGSRKWGRPYLTRAWFDQILTEMREHIVLVLAFEDGRPVAGTLNFYQGNRLYGRYWGCIETHEYLHFECCFYRLIEFAIENDIDVFEAGAQGEQKFLRGFPARPTYSAHYILAEDGRTAIAEFLRRERIHQQQLIEAYNRKSPRKDVRAAALARKATDPSGSL